MKSELEQRRILEKLKEFSTLFIFISLSAIISILLMDLIVFPLTVFAIKQKVFFTIIFLIFVIFLFLSYVLLSFSRKLFYYTKNGLLLLEALKKTILDLFSFFASCFVLIFITLLIVGFIYFITTKNYQFLYEILN